MPGYPIPIEEHTLDQEKSMETKRILICSNEFILGASLINLLAGEDDLEVVGLAGLGQEALLKAIHKYRPFAVVISDIYLVSDKTFLTHIIHHYPGLKIISVNTDNNQINAYRNKEYTLSQASDLASIIRSY